MKPNSSKLLLLSLLIAFLSISTARPTGAQPADPPQIMVDGEFPLDIDQIQPIMVDRNDITVMGGDNALNTASTWYSISGTTFVPASSAITYQYGGGGCVDTGFTGDLWRGTVNLPHGSTILGLWFNYKNQIADPIDSDIYLRRYKFDGDYDSILLNVGSQTGIGYHSKFEGSVQFNVVDNFLFNYVLVWNGMPDQNLCGVNILYTPPPLFLSALPMINR